MAKEQFITRHVGPRSEDVEEMLKVIGVKSVDELIEQTVPASIRLKKHWIYRNLYRRMNFWKK